MKRKTSEVPSRVWSFGCRKPVVELDRVHGQLRAAHNYYNVLVDIELQRRAEYRAARLKASPELEAHQDRYRELDEALKQARAAIKALRKKTRKRSESAELNATVKELKAKKTVAWQAVKSARDRVSVTTDAQFAATVEAIDAAANERVKAAREKTDAYWGTYLLTERSFQAALEAARKNHSDPERKRWTGSGRVGVQIQGGITMAELFGSDTRIQVDPLPPDTWSTRSGRRHAHTTVRLRVGSTDKGKPVWASIPMLMHRPLPSDGIIKWAWLKITRVGMCCKYDLQITVENEVVQRTGQGTIAVDVGWRMMDDGGLRIGYTYDDRGQSRELRLPVKLIRRFGLVPELRSNGDVHFNAARDHMVDWMRKNPQAVPEWMCQVRVPNSEPVELTTVSVVEITYRMTQWRSHVRLAKMSGRWVREIMPEDRITQLWELWKVERLAPPRKRSERVATRHDLFASAEEIIQFCRIRGANEVEQVALYLEFWRRKNRHLYQWERNQERRVALWRRNQYRVWAAEFAGTYHTIVFEAFDLRPMASRPKPEDGADTETNRVSMRHAAISEFRDAVLSAVGAGRVVLEEPANTTRQCAYDDCLHLPHDGVDVGAATRIVLQCEHCGQSEDQDRRAARNLLRRYGERLRGETDDGHARSGVKTEGSGSMEALSGSPV